MTRSELAAYPPLLLCLAVALSGNVLGLVGIGVWFLAYGVRRER